VGLRRAAQILSILVAVSCYPIARAQVNSASLDGLITDQTNAVMPNAHISVTNVNTGYTREGDTDASGYYSFQDLPIGEYKIVVSIQSFESVESRVALGTAEKVRRDLTLKLGSAQANVEMKKVTNNLSPDDASIARGD
jgi:hypothetical protein